MSDMLMFNFEIGFKVDMCCWIGNRSISGKMNLENHSALVCKMAGVIMKKDDVMKTARVILSLFMLSPIVVEAAYDFINCDVVEIVLGGNDKNAHILLSCDIDNRPACGLNKYVAFDRSTDSGKQKLAIFIAAFSAGFKVSGYIDHAEGSCPAWQSNVSLLTSVRAKK